MAYEAIQVGTKEKLLILVAVSSSSWYFAGKVGGVDMTLSKGEQKTALKTPHRVNTFHLTIPFFGKQDCP